MQIKERWNMLQRGTIMKNFASVLRRLHADTDGATSTEYILILALIVLPIGLMMPLFVNMARVYGARIISLMPLPF